MSGAIETHAVEFGQFGKDYQEAAEKLGIPQAGVFILASFEDMIKTGDIDVPEMKTAQELLLDLADKIEHEGIKPEERTEVAQRLRYLAQFILMRPVPTE
jgi:hypothetical protein